MDYTPLYRSLGYVFQQADKLTTALTHRSAGMPNNERLEFLGDALLGYIMAELLFERFPVASEGELTRLRSSLVRKETLAEIARQQGFSQFLRLGGGEMKSGGWRRDSILADALEAIIGAVYQDGGMEACHHLIQKLWQPYLNQLTLKISKDPKTRLQEYLQSRQHPLPVYKVLCISGSDHEQQFEVECQIQALNIMTTAIGRSRRRAEQAAAEAVLKQLEKS